MSGRDLWLCPSSGQHCADSSRSWGSPDFVLHQPQLPSTARPRLTISPSISPPPPQLPALVPCMYLILNNLSVHPRKAEKLFPSPSIEARGELRCSAALRVIPGLSRDSYSC